MKDKTKSTIHIFCIIALILCVLWAVFKVFVFLGLLTGWGGVSEKVNWSGNVTIKVIFFIVYFLSSVALIGLCFRVILNTLKGMSEHIVFPQSNVKPLFWLAVASFVYMLCWINQPLLHRDYFVFGFVGVNLVLPFFLLFFAFMYKVAADAVEENNLTI